MIGLHFLLLLNIIIFSSCLAQHNSSFVIAMAGNKGFAFKLIAVVEKIRSMKKGRSYAIVGFDLGFTEEERSLLTCSTPTLLSELRRFPFQRYPDHVKRLGCYAWKPLIIRELRSEGRGGIIWMDTAVGFQGPSPATARLDFLERALETAERFSGGVLSDRTQGELSRWTHPATFSYFEKTYGWSRERFEHGGVHNCNGGFSVWSFGTDKAVSERTNVAALALQQWSDCALKAECVCPGGSNRGNHRQDQAALTLVVGCEVAK